jgi:hypothetical protein
MVFPTGANRRGFLIFTLFLAAGVSVAKQHKEKYFFRYVAGTEDVAWNCEGQLQLTAKALTFRCPQQQIVIPYASITLMQYRPDVARNVKSGNLSWKIRPPRGGGKKNRYFTVLYARNGNPQGMVLEASPEVMRPYLAEIELRAGKRVEVRGYEDYN